MKKSLILILLLILSVAAVSAGVCFSEKSGWKKLTNYIYIDKNSITKNGDIATGKFKIYDSPENRLYKIGDIDIYYQINVYEVECTNPMSISIANSKSYDKNNNLLDEYINEQGYACTYPCLINDDIFVKELCK